MPRVTIYTTPTCGYCVMAKKFFQENKIEYNEIDVAEDQAQAQEMVEKTGQMGVPVIVIENDGAEEIIIGFDEKRVRKLLIPNF